MSDVGLKKHFAAMDVPAPERGYWAKLKAGKPAEKILLPPRGPGMPESTSIGRNHHNTWRYDPEGILTEPMPVEPAFAESIEAVRERVMKRAGKVVSVRNLKTPHPIIRKYLEADEKRREKQQSSPFLSSFYAPHFDSGFEQRRLRVLNSLFQALARWGAKPAVQGDKAREISVAVGVQTVSFRLDHPSAKPNRHGEWSTRSGKADTLELAIAASKDVKPTLVWTDIGDRKLEDRLTEVVVELIIQGEQQFRIAARRDYDWRLKRRADAEIEVRKRRSEAERQAREKRLKEEKEAQDLLISQARAFRDAGDIRAFVGAARARGAALSVDTTAIDAWATWALDVADRLDPLANLAVKNGSIELGKRT